MIFWTEVFVIHLLPRGLVRLLVCVFTLRAFGGYCPSSANQSYFHIFAVAYTTYCCTLFRYTIPCSLWALCPHIASCHMIPCIRSFLSPTVLLSILYMDHFCPRKGMAKLQCCSHRSHTVRNYTAVLRASSPHWWGYQQGALWMMRGRIQVPWWWW